MQGESEASKETHGIPQLGEGDSYVIYNALSDDWTVEMFGKLRDEVMWQQMHHTGGVVPRLVCCQATIDGEDGSTPVYRHPSDETLPTTPFTNLVDRIRRDVEVAVGHEMNHVLIQLYRSGEDFISEHSDKTLDITRSTTIVNVSLGAQRTMRLRTKKAGAKTESGDRLTQLVPMPRASLFALGPQTNMRWLHGIRADKRPMKERSEVEKAFGGERISLTFRSIATFLSKDGSFIWGQGATEKTRDQCSHVVNGDSEKSQDLINAFGFENHASDFDWDGIYGAGFDVLHSAKQA